MRVLLYLPVMNPWWFEHIVVPLMRAMVPACDMHVMLPPPWRCTGLDRDQAHALAGDLPVTWHWLDAPEHQALRLDGAAYPGLVERVTAIAPDLTLCRAADLVTPAAFPGTVRYLMEASVPLFTTTLTRIQFADTIFDHGFMPTATAAPVAAIDQQWQQVHAAYPPRGGPALPDGRLLLALPLEYEGTEMFFRAHARFASNAELIDWLMHALPDDVVLALTNHPLNDRYIDAGPLQAQVAHYGDRIVLVPETGEPGRSTAMLARRANGMILCDSKSIFLPAIFGTPCLRFSSFASAPWMRVHDDLHAFIAALRAGTAATAAPEDARAWIAWHLAQGSVDVADPTLDAAAILRCARTAPSPLRHAA